MAWRFQWHGAALVFEGDLGDWLAAGTMVDERTWAQEMWRCHDRTAATEAELTALVEAVAADETYLPLAVSCSPGACQTGAQYREMEVEGLLGVAQVVEVVLVLVVEIADNESQSTFNDILSTR